MMENSWIEILERDKSEKLGQMRAKIQVAESHIKVGDRLIGNDYTRQAFLLFQEINRITRRISLIQSSIN